MCARWVALGAPTRLRTVATRSSSNVRAVWKALDGSPRGRRTAKKFVRLAGKTRVHATPAGPTSPRVRTKVLCRPGVRGRSIAATAIGRDRAGHTAHWRSTEGEPVVQRFTKALGSASSGRSQRPVTGGSAARAGNRAARRRARTTGVMAGVATLAALAMPGLAGATVNAPANIISFPSRDFVSATGYDLNKLY